MERSGSIQVGRLGQLRLAPGIYLYVGSALGPGGVRARVDRHLRVSKRLHWHIDYLLPAARPSLLFFVYSEQRLEHRWAGQLCKQLQVEIPLAGFGASDCACPAHLIFFAQMPQPIQIRRVLEGTCPSNLRVHQLGSA